MRIAVIGGNGQVGSYLLPMLVREGHDVICVSRGMSGYARVTPELDEVREVRLRRGDVGFEQGVGALCPDVVVDVVCFTREEAEAMVRVLRPDKTHYVAVGSIWIHGRASCVPMNEDECRTPLDEYGRGKLELTDYLMGLGADGGFPATVVHPGHIVAPGVSSIVGPQANRDMRVIEALRDGRQVVLPNLGLETLHHVHAADVAGVIDAAIRTGEPAFGQEYHAVSRRAMTLVGLAEGVAELFGRRANLRFLPFDQFAREVGDENAACTLEHISHSPSCSPAKAERELGYLTGTAMEAIEEHLRALGMLGA